MSNVGHPSSTWKQGTRQTAVTKAPEISICVLFLANREGIASALLALEGKVYDPKLLFSCWEKVFATKYSKTHSTLGYKKGVVGHQGIVLLGPGA